ncbi:hypothetical protein FSARC_7185 [Fusarium sarcochroum]|uniref:Uncharacterized protein n=1 Tax=Fusarium sarcochroum TaxID=1208366 RepID=A0A8H4TVU5_9HYPO|nr:hypothetical protein FSARC_7185 [Fusarium sarcochroum]
MTQEFLHWTSLSIRNVVPTTISQDQLQANFNWQSIFGRIPGPDSQDRQVDYVVRSNDSLEDRDNHQIKPQSQDNTKDGSPDDHIPKKQRQHPTFPSEGSRKSTRGSSKPQPSQTQLLKYMLSKGAEELCRPEDKAKDITSHGRKEKLVIYTSGTLTPFQELLGAIEEAGIEKVHRALLYARKQHKAKAADQIVLLADVILDKYLSNDDPEGERLVPLLSRDDFAEALG